MKSNRFCINEFTNYMAVQSLTILFLKINHSYTKTSTQSFVFCSNSDLQTRKFRGRKFQVLINSNFSRKLAFAAILFRVFVIVAESFSIFIGRTINAARTNWTKVSHFIPLKQFNLSLISLIQITQKFLRAIKIYNGYYSQLRNSNL